MGRHMSRKHPKIELSTANMIPGLVVPSLRERAHGCHGDVLDCCYLLSPARDLPLEVVILELEQIARRLQLKVGLDRAATTGGLIGFVM